MALTKITGSVIKDSVSLSGNVSVGGTLTYQDVTNVDALGIGTFRTGINVIAGQVDVGSNIKIGNAGVITATSFVGSGANLTSLPAQATIANNGDNRVITGGSGVNLNAESKLTFDGTGLLHLNNSTGSSDAVLKLESESGSDAKLTLDTSNGGGAGAHIEFLIDGTLKGGISYVSNASASDTHDIIFKNNSNTERLRIDSSGRLLLGTTTAGYGDLDDLTIATSGNTGITIRSGTSSLGVIGFADGTSGNTQYRGVIQYNHSSDAMEFNTADAQRMRILGDGRVLINTSDGAAFSSRKLSVADVSSGGTTAIEIRSATNGSGRLYFTDSTSSGDAGSYAGKVFYDHNTDYMGFYTGGGTNTPGERMKIDAYGRVTTPNQPSFSAHSTDNNWDISNGSVFPWNSTRHNTGSHFNTSNYRFTAPVTGTYEFSFYSIYNTNLSNANGACVIRVNGSVPGQGTRCHFTKTNSNWDHVSYSVKIELNANDYIDMVNDGGQTIRYHGGQWSSFTGQLVS